MARKKPDQTSDKVFGSKRGPAKSFTAQVRDMARGKNPLAGVRRVAERFGVSERTVKGWLKGGRPSKSNREHVQAETERRHEDRSRKSAERKLEQLTEPDAPVRARLVASGEIGLIGGGSSYTRQRHIERELSADQVARLYAATVSDDEAARIDLAAEVLAEYFNTGVITTFTPADMVFEPGQIEFI